MERWELLEGSYGLYQDKELGCFTEDSIRLVHFMRLKSGDRCLDLGTGNGIIPLYVRSRGFGKWSGVDIREEQLVLARRSAQKNGFSMEFICCRAQEATNFFHGVPWISLLATHLILIVPCLQKIRDAILCVMGKCWKSLFKQHFRF